MIAVIDYGIGNVRSVMNALEFVGARAVLTRDVEVLAGAKGLILPGVGAFAEGMRRLDMHQLRHPLLSMARAGKPLLGICLGFQMLMTSSTEQGQNDGLALMEGEVIRLPVDARLPHIGWGKVSVTENASGESQLLKGINGESFYFVHSYAVVKPPSDSVAGLANYAGCDLVASLESGNVYGTQFHPEKSGPAGLQLLRNYLAVCS